MSENNGTTGFATFPFSGAAADRCRGLTESCTLTHTMVEETGKVLCRVKATNLLDDYLWDGEGSADRAPTCPTCLKKDPRFNAKK